MLVALPVRSRGGRGGGGEGEGEGGRSEGCIAEYVVCACGPYICTSGVCACVHKNVVLGPSVYVLSLTHT